ncbi:hypothetical protein VTJ49DRAFT_2312 [Mycothermus thermophilus]|uniref:Uncharacterized protein n=1 Tax=Humicola insolens TaxID=85995 RepID=A0ABR3VRG4_HUMIN
MPSVAQESPSVQSKKRRRDDHEDHILSRECLAEKTFNHEVPFTHHQYGPLVAQKFIPFPAGKRQRTVDIDIDADHEPMQHSPSGSNPGRHTHYDEIGHRDHRLRKDTSTARYQSDEKARSSSTAPVTRPSTSSLMARCHVCSRKPSKKSDLDSFADCHGCGQRTCYVCIRECLGWGPNITMPTPDILTRSLPPIPLATATITTPTITSPTEEPVDTSFTMLDADAADDDHDKPSPQPQPPSKSSLGTQHEQQELRWATTGGGHRRVVCSRCCVERGSDGDVVCLGCLPFVEG